MKFPNRQRQPTVAPATPAIATPEGSALDVTVDMAQPDGLPQPAPTRGISDVALENFRAMKRSPGIGGLLALLSPRGSWFEQK